MKAQALGYEAFRSLSPEELLSAHAPMVGRIAQHLAQRLPASISVDDLIQCGMIRLLECATRYDSNQAASFETYASYRVRGAMLDEIRANSWAPRSVTREAREISSAMADLHMEGSVTPSSKDIAKKLEITLDEYYAALDRVSRGRLLSFDELAADGRDSDDLVDHSGEAPAESVLKREVSAQLVSAIERLPLREKQIISLYYIEELNLKEIGAVLEVSESRVSQLHTQILLRLRALMEANGK